MVTLGPLGIAASGLVADRPDAEIALAREAEAAGYSTVWLAGGQGNNLPVIDRVVRATERIQVASGILSVDVVPAGEVARTFAGLERAFPGRFVVGLGGAHGPRPLRTLNAYLDILDSPDGPDSSGGTAERHDGELRGVPASARVLAALGPNLLALARDRASGAYPYLVTPDYVAQARGALGTGPALAVLLPIIAETDPATARATAADSVRFFGTIPGYRRNFLRMGFTEPEIDGLAPRFLDAMTVWGDFDSIAARLREYHTAGADQVVLRFTGDAGKDAGVGSGLLQRFAEALLP
ncbi:TIGR03620 family F420-dependent LLM class oxidoreductase [Frankia sp. Cpl3]|nr:TIGR03620 family F420-dependent LLM class oxidoreductase [Frankia sp. Cpl3]